MKNKFLLLALFGLCLLAGRVTAAEWQWSVPVPTLPDRTNETPRAFLWSVDGVQAIGRLDQDTTGLLILSDDGQFIHRMASPKHHVPKVYVVTTKHAVEDAAISALLSGVVLHDDPEPVRAVACLRVSDNAITLTLTEGKYHQVKRMLAAVGNRVEALHRAQMGGLALDADLAAGQWRWLTASDLAAIKAPQL